MDAMEEDHNGRNRSEVLVVQPCKPIRRERAHMQIWCGAHMCAVSLLDHTRTHTRARAHAHKDIRARARTHTHEV
jgi:hypothetical protein